MATRDVGRTDLFKRDVTGQSVTSVHYVYQKLQPAVGETGKDKLHKDKD